MTTRIFSEGFDETEQCNIVFLEATHYLVSQTVSPWKTPDLQIFVSRTRIYWEQGSRLI